MSDDEKPISTDVKPAPLTSQRLRDLALEHLLKHNTDYLSTEENIGKRLITMLDHMVSFAEQVATESLANRQCLTNLKTLSHLIPGDPDKDLSDGSRYELRYRVVEQIANEKPFKDSAFSLSEAVETYGEGFVDLHWGKLGEHCPKRMTVADDRTMWFTVVRVPAVELTQSADIEQVQRSRMNQG